MGRWSAGRSGRKKETGHEGARKQAKGSTRGCVPAWQRMSSCISCRLLYSILVARPSAGHHPWLMQGEHVYRKDEDMTTGHGVEVHQAKMRPCVSASLHIIDELIGVLARIKSEKELQMAIGSTSAYISSFLEGNLRKMECVSALKRNLRTRFGLHFGEHACFRARHSARVSLCVRYETLPRRTPLDVQPTGCNARSGISRMAFKDA